MRSKIDTQSEEAEKAVRDIRRATRRHFSAEDKVRIVIAGLRAATVRPTVPPPMIRIL
jgi:transposase